MKINFICIMKKIAIFAASYIQIGGLIRLLAAGFFCACTLHCFGSEPPCGALMRPLPIWCTTTGKAEPFFFSAKQTKLSVMSYTEKLCLNGKITPTSDRQAHETSEKSTREQLLTLVRNTYPQLRNFKVKKQYGKSYRIRAKYKERSLNAYAYTLEKAIAYFFEEVHQKVYVQPYWDSPRQTLPKTGNF